MNADPRLQMEEAKNLIKAKRYSEARVILERVDNPTAKRWLEKLDEIEMFGAPLAASPTIPAPPPTRATRRTRERPQNTPQQLLQQTTGVFLRYDWELSTQFNDMVQVQKKRAPSSLGAAALIAIFGLIGMFIVMIAIAGSKTEQVSLQALTDGTVQVVNRKRTTTISAPSQVESLAKSVSKGATYGATLALGIGATIVWALILYH